MASLELNDLYRVTQNAEMPRLCSVNLCKRITVQLAILMVAATLPVIHALPASAESFAVSTTGGSNGPGDFSQPTGVSIAPDGTVYVADQNRFKLKKIVGSTVSDFATIPSSLSPDPLNTDTSYCSVYVKNSDEIFASDCRNLYVFKYNKSGTLLRTYTNSLSVPLCKNCRDWGGGLAVDNLGGIFLSDEHNQLIIRIDENSGTSSLHAGVAGRNGSIDGEANLATFNIPRGLAVDSKNNLYVADRNSSSIRRITPNRTVSTVQANLACVYGVAVGSNDEIFGINERYCAPTIFRLGAGKVFEDLTANKNGISGFAGKPSFNGGSGISIDRYGLNPTNRIFIADWINHSIKVFSSSGNLIQVIGSKDTYGINYSTDTDTLWDFPLQIFPLDDETSLVADNFTIRHINNEGRVLRTTHLAQSCWYSGGVAFAPDGTFFCTNGHAILVRYPDGTSGTIGTNVPGRRDGDGTIAQFNRPDGLAFFRGDLYVADMDNRQIRKVTRTLGTKSFTVSTILGTGVWTNAPDLQQRSKATFAAPVRIAIDALGNLYIVDGGIGSVFKTSLVQENDVTKIATGLRGWPSSIAIDKENKVYVSTYAGAFYRIQNNRMVSIGGKVGYGNEDGPLSNASFNRPGGLSIDAKGNLLVADRDNNKIKKVSVGTTPGLNLISSSSVTAYLRQSEINQPSPQGMSKAQETALEENLIKNNNSGLVAKVYQSKNVQIPLRSTVGLPLCDVKIEKQISFDWGYSALSNANGCGKEFFLVTYKGYITWPGKGEQARVIYASVDDGMQLKVNNETIIDRWSDSAANPIYPFNRSGIATLEGGRQYPIEIWYYAWGAPSSFKLYWSPISANQRDETRIIEPEVFSPKLLSSNESKPLVAKPGKPFGPKVSINLNFINLTVSLPIGAKTALLFAPEFGVPKSRAILGQIFEGKASFEIAVSRKYAGKKGNLQIVSRNEVGESSPLNLPITGPRVQSKPVAAKTVAPKPPAQVRQPLITCLKGITKRTFEGTYCPPGYTRG